MDMGEEVSRSEVGRGRGRVGGSGGQGEKLGRAGGDRQGVAWCHDPCE